MKWIATDTIEPAELEGTVSGQFGGYVLFVAFSPLTGWWWIYPHGMETVAEPPYLFLEPEWAKLHPRKSPVVHREKPHRIRRRKTEQLMLGL